MTNEMARKLADMIPHRRSVRAYRAECMDDAVLADVQRFMDGLTPLVPGARVEGRIIPTAHGNFMQKWKTPHFIVIFSEQTDDGLLNAGFMYQQLDLYAQSLGLGTCWVGLGSLSDREAVPEGLKVAVMMAIGLPDEIPQRCGAAEFKRKPMEELTDLPDMRLEVLRLAPSATNSQPWYVTHEGEQLHIWRELGLIKQRTHGRMNRIDMGIGLCHLYVAHPDTFRFVKVENPPVQAGQIYVGSVML